MGDACSASLFECTASTGGGCCPIGLNCWDSLCYYRNGTAWGPQASPESTLNNSFRGLLILIAVLAVFLCCFCGALLRRSGARCARGLPTATQPPVPAALLVLQVPEAMGAPLPPQPPLPPPPQPLLPAQELQPDPARWRAVPVPLPASGSLGLFVFDAVGGLGCFVRSLTPSSPLRGIVFPGDRLLQIGDGLDAKTVLAEPFESIQAVLACTPKPTLLVFLRRC